MAVGGSSIAPVITSWVEANPRLEWRWIQWIQIIIIAAYLPLVPFMPETRSAVLLRKQAKKMRGLVEQGKGMDGLEGMEGLQQGVFRARSEEGKPKLIDLIKVSLIRPLRTFPGLYPSGRFSLTSYSLLVIVRLTGDRTDRHLLHSMDLSSLGCILRSYPIHPLCL
jgi:MFS family permease